MFLVAVLLVTQVAAHGYVPWIIINGTRIAGWDVNTGPCSLKVFNLAHVLTHIFCLLL